MTKITTLPVASLEVCDRVRVRAQKPKVNSGTVQDYAEAYECRLITEPLDVFREKGTERYVVADGENRLLGLRKAKIPKVECRLHEGDELAALDFAINCNQAHGLPRTKADKYRAFELIMDTPLRDKYRTDTELSEKIGVSIRTIQSYKAEWRESRGGDRKAKRQAKESAEKNTRQGLKKDDAACIVKEEKPVVSAANEGISVKPKSRLTQQHKATAKQVSDNVKREQLDAQNRKSAFEAINAIRAIPHDGTTAAKKGWDLEAAHVRYVADWCAEYLAAKGRAAA